MKKLALLLLSVTLPMATAMAQVSFGESSLFDEGWSFIKEDVPHGQDIDLNDSAWEKVSLPHDWSVKGPYSPTYASCTGYLPAGIGWYRKHFDGKIIDKDQAFVYFEGVYNRSSVYLNGHLLGERPSGYISFMYDMTPYINKDGDNVLAVRVDHSRIADSRWYTGSGIYRDVWLVQSGKTHFAQWGVGYVATDISGRQATVNVDVAIEGPVKGKLSLAIKDANGTVAAKTSARAMASQTASMKLKNPHLWNLDDPYLYTLEAAIVDGKDTLDKTSA